MYAALNRAAERWRGIRITEFEQRQLRAIREEIHKDFAARNAPAATAPQSHLSSSQQPTDLTLALAPAIAVSDDITRVEGANVVARSLGDDVIKGGVDQVMPLRGQRRLGPVVFDFVRPPKHLEVFLLPVAAYHP
jgi:hypothetical protein